MISFVTRLNERLAALPGVESVGRLIACRSFPSEASFHLVIEGKTILPGHLRANQGKPEMLPPMLSFPGSARVTPALGIPLRQGREFGRRKSQSLPVAIINEAMAQRYWPGENPMGKRLHLPRGREKISDADELADGGRRGGERQTPRARGSAEAGDLHAVAATAARK